MKRTKHTLITAELLGFFMIIIAVLGILTDNKIFYDLTYILFALIILTTFIFVTFFILAVKKGPEKNNLVQKYERMEQRKELKLKKKKQRKYPVRYPARAQKKSMKKSS